MIEHLEAWLRDEILDLVINVPPGTSKSLTVSTLFAAYVWIERPSWRWIAASYDRTVVDRSARRHRELVASDWWAARWPSVAIPSGASDSKSVGFFFNNRGGSRYSTTTGGAVTGQHADGHLIDDPHDVDGVASLAELEHTLSWHRETMPTRFRDPKRPRRVLVMQRLHERDLTTEMTREGATVLCLPMRYESRHPHRWAKDPRRVEGELLCPERYDEAAVARLERRLGPRAAAAQLQQRPAPAEGAIFKASWLTRRWTEIPRGGTWGISLDATFKDTKTADFVVLQVWCTVGVDHYLIDQVRGRMDFVETLRAFVALAAKYPQALLKLVEDKANGPAILSVLKTKLPGLVAVEPYGSKEARGQAVEPVVAAGNVVLPHETDAVYPDGRRGAPWVPEFVHEVTTVPGAANDDQFDAMTQYLNHVAQRGGELLEAAMANLESMFGGG
jgi:predicted phage terminase large subunit-like protein